jgi:hypothetical protein
VPASDATRTYLRDEGNVAVLIDGSVVFSPADGKSYDNGEIWHQLAYAFEGNDFDSYNGHSNPGGTYHHHVNPKTLYSTNSSVHSGIIGYAFDGYPIYGPYAYTNTNGTGAIKRMTTSWKKRSITARTTLPDGTTASQTGPTLSTQTLGKYFEDYEYSAGYGDLDRYNGRFSVTPEYPNGTYAYFVTLDASSNPEFPYLVGDYFYGTPLKSGSRLQNAGTLLTTNTIPSTGTTLYSAVLPIELDYFTAQTEECFIQLNWKSNAEVNAQKYIIEYSQADKDVFEPLTTIWAKGSNENYAFVHSPTSGEYNYRLKMVDLDGEVNYSAKIEAKIDCGFKEIDINIYPNPFHNSITLNASEEGQYLINIYSNSGKKLPLVLLTKR